MAALLIAGTTVAGAAASRMTAAEMQAVQQALNRGALLYAYDQAAWHGTDDFLAKADAATRARSGGWIVDGPADAPELVFVDKSPDPHALYVADFKDGKLIASRLTDAGDDTALSPMRRRMVAALVSARAALGADRAVFTCGKAPFNTVVLPPTEPDAPIPVYLLTPQTERDVYPLGGHFRADVESSGRVTIRAFTKAGLPMRRPAAGGKSVEALVVSHLLDPTPTETHVFSSLAAHLPIYVVTGDRLWAVEGNRIRALEREKK